MQIVATQLRQNMVIKYENDLYIVTWAMHRTPGKGVACMQTTLKNIVTGKNMEVRFRSADKVEKVEIISRPMQYLYKDGDHYTFMDQEDFDQHAVSESAIGDAAEFLIEAQVYPVAMYEGNCVGVELPQTVELKVTMAPPEIRKATASSSLRPVETENGMTIQAPSFVKTGDIIRVNTTDRSYVERVN